MTFSQEAINAIEYWKKFGHGLSCPKAGGRKNKYKKLKGGTGEHSPMIDNVICAIESSTTLYDLPSDILVLILINAKEGSEDANKIIQTMSLVSTNFKNLRPDLVAYQTNIPNAQRNEEARQHLLNKFDSKGFFYSEQVHIFCNFLENIIRNFKDTISESGLEILFTKEFLYQNETYDVVYNKIIYAQDKITYKLCGKTNIQYKNNKNTTFINSDANENPDLILAIKSANYQQTQLRNDPGFFKEFFKDIEFKYDTLLFEKLYYYFVEYDDSVIGDYVTEQIIYKIVDNDYYVQIPNASLNLAIANIQIIPEIYKQLKIDTASIFKKFADNMAIENLFETYKEILKKKQNTLEVKEPPVLNVQKPPFDFSRLYDVYFTKDEIMKITFYSMKKLKEDPENPTFINLFQKYIQRINASEISDEEKTKYTEITKDLREIRKAQILAEITNDI